MASSASGATSSANAAQALTVAGTQYDKLLETLTALVDDGPAQTQIANAIQPTVAGKARIIEILTSLLPSLPPSAQPIVASIITALGAGDATEVVNLDNAIDGGTLPVGIAGIVSQALAIATEAIESAMALINSSVLPLLPTEVQGPLGGVLGTVTSIVGTLIPSVISTVTGLVDSILGSLPFIGGGAGGGGLFGGLLGGLLGGDSPSTPGGTGVAGIGGIFDVITDLLGSLFGGGSATPGTTPSTGGIGGIVGGVLGTVTSLIDSLLGGLLGGAGPAT